MKRVGKAEVKKVVLTASIGGRKKPVKKEALVSVKSGEIIKFVDKSNP
jgi:hypothetical protein